MKKLTVVVTGGRDYSDQVMLDEVLDALDPDFLIIGDAKGADTLAKEWAESRPNQSSSMHLAQWDLYGKKAGPLRNAAMLDKACTMMKDDDSGDRQTLVVAFKGGAGTENCIRQAIERNLIVLRVEP
jgi:hypothetical protein